MNPNNMLRRTLRFGAATVSIALMLMHLPGCDGPLHPNFFDNPELDPFPGGGTPPAIESITPDRGFAGDEAVITGGPFPINKEHVMVNVGVRTAEILELSESSISIRLPANESGDRRVRVAVWGAETWSNELSFNYLSDFVAMNFGIPNPKGVAVDDEGNLYISSLHEQAIYRVLSADSTKSLFASLPVTGPMEFGPSGDLYVVSSTGLARVTPGGAVEEVVALNDLVDFDWNSNGDIFLLLVNQVRLFSGGSHEQVGSVAQAQRIRVFDGHVYVSELARARVVRFQITGNTLGPLQAYFLGGTPLMGLDLDRTGAVYASAFVRDYVFRAAPDREDDSDVEEIPDETDRANPFRRISTRIGDVYIYNSVMYLVEDVSAGGEPGRVYRIFVGETNAPRYGRDA